MNIIGKNRNFIIEMATYHFNDKINSFLILIYLKDHKNVLWNIIVY